MAEQKQLNFSDELRQEYERQLRNIRSLRQLYEERQKAERKEKDELASQLDDAKLQLQNEQKRVRWDIKIFMYIDQSINCFWLFSISVISKNASKN